MIRSALAAFAVLLISTNLYAQQVPSPSADTTVTDSRPGWSSTPFIAFGYGTPQGFRAEAGYRFGEFLTIGFMFGIFDDWSRDPEEGTRGAFAQFHVPIGNQMAIHTFIGMGGTFFGMPDTYQIISLGFTYPLNTFLTVRPEVGIVYTSRRYSMDIISKLPPPKAVAFVKTMPLKGATCHGSCENRSKLLRCCSSWRSRSSWYFT